MNLCDAQTDERGCPVCGAASRPLLSLPAQPIYQHPVPVDAIVPKPHVVDLCWVACLDCAHAWQPKFDHALLETIYRSHYYTPAPDGIAEQFRNDFIAALTKFGLLTKRRHVLLEIGASNGDVLAELKRRTGAMYAYAFEPNSENAEVARRRGLDVRECFFDENSARDRLESAELIYARHVIEHVFQLDDFFAGLNAVATPSADLVLETPSLDHHAHRDSFDPFHVEHLHVFSLRSLAALSSVHGWRLIQSELTPAGNLIAAFKRIVSIPEIGRSEPPAPILEGMQQAVERYRRHMLNILAGRQFVFWGAGSAGIRLASTIGRIPDYWTDGNPNKFGRKFVGLNGQIVSPEYAFEEAKYRCFGAPVLVITSSFVREILPRVRRMGWADEVYDLTGKSL